MNLPKQALPVQRTTISAAAKSGETSGVEPSILGLFPLMMLLNSLLG